MSAFIWSRVSGHLANVSPIFTLRFSSVFGLLKTAEGNIWLLVAYFVGLLFSQVAFFAEGVCKHENTKALR